VVNSGFYVDRFRVLGHTQFQLLTPFLHTSDEELWLIDQVVLGSPGIDVLGISESAWFLT